MKERKTFFKILCSSINKRIFALSFAIAECGGELIFKILYMNRYETVFILTPVLSEEQTKEAVKVYEDFITSNGGAIKHKEFWGLKKMAYQIQKKSNGFYNLVEFEAQGDLIQKLEIAFKRDERIMRFLTVRMEKDHVAFAEKTRNAAKA